MVVATEPAFVDAWVRPLRELITIAVYVAVVGVLYRRVRASTHLGKRMVAPVLTVAIVRSLAIAGGIALRRAAPASVALDVASWIFVLCLPALALAFFIGILRSRLLAGNALQRLALGLRHQTEAEDLRDVLASALEDPSLEVAYWIPDHPGRWVDAAGKDVQLPVGQPGRCVTVVRERDRQLAAFIHDPALREQRPFVEAAGSFAASALENQRLRAQVDASLESLRASRARIQAAADSERRRIERDLHDGAQQRLAALRVRLDLAAEAVAEDPKQGALLLRELGEEVEDALDDVRSLARGIYPALLADRGVEEALQAAARRSPVAATVATRGLGRYPPEIEAAVYFCCLEALQNVAKHARGATSASVTAVDDGALRFDVRDDGSGFVVDSVLEGTGLANMRDRVGAVGGKLTISSRPGAGTHVAGVIPLPRAGRPAHPRPPVERRSPG
jgi:signal transduction histidine kinase